MKGQVKQRILLFIVLLLLTITIVQVTTEAPAAAPVTILKRVEVPVRVPVEREFRDAPIKRYKPGYTQQVGVLVGEEETLPIYSREVRGRRDRYHYYTVTPGNQQYSLPVTVGDRDCMDDMGCQELYGNEAVSVLGEDGQFSAKIYRTDNFF
jgi:hypothetical protein